MDASEYSVGRLSGDAHLKSSKIDAELVFAASKVGTRYEGAPLSGLRLLSLVAKLPYVADVTSMISQRANTKDR